MKYSTDISSFLKLFKGCPTDKCSLGVCNYLPSFIFQNFVALVMILVRWCIPDMSVELRDQIRREVYITNEIIIDQEAQRARFGKSNETSPAYVFNEKLFFFRTR